MKTPANRRFGTRLDGPIGILLLCVSPRRCHVSSLSCGLESELYLP
ncbi:hypothetical protein [Synechococcus sp. M16CYN]